MFEIHDIYIEEETFPRNFSCPKIVPVNFPPMVSMNPTPLDPLEGVVDNYLFSHIHLSEIITISSKENSFPLSLSTTITLTTSSSVAISPSKLTEKPTAPTKMASMQPYQAQFPPVFV